jgi:hypothetical protein
MWGMVIDLGIYGSVLMSRLGLFLIIFIQIFRKKFFAVACLIIIFTCVYFYGVVEDSILGETFEFLLNYQRTGNISTKSSTDIMGMRWLPNSQREFWIGSGQFFDGEGFYNETDIGFARLMFFGGICYTIFFLLINFWGFLFKRIRLRVGWVEFFGFLFILLLSNIKSLILLNWVAIYYILRFNKLDLQQQSGSQQQPFKIDTQIVKSV